MSERSRHPLSYVAAIAAATALIAISVGVAWTAWKDIAAIAIQDPEQSHVLLALPVVVWLAWLRRGRLRFLRPEPSWLGPIVIAVGFTAFALGYLNRREVVWHGGAVMMAAGSLLTAFGFRMTNAFRPAVFALVFLIPVPGAVRMQIADPLQQMTARISELLFQAVDLDVVRSGNVLIVNGVEVAVAEACNGMRMVSALALVAYAFVFSTPMTSRIRLFILLLSPAVALLVNVIRIVPVVLMYGYQNRGAADLFHDFSGWLALGVAFGIFYAVLALLRWLDIPILPYAVRDAEMGAMNEPTPSTRRGRGFVWSTWTPILGAIGVLAMCLPVALRIDPPAVDTTQYFADIKSAVIDIPKRGRTLGSLVGKDATESEQIQAAIELLRPNVLIQRRYIDVQTGDGFDLLFVHCADARDMRGHYPPNCYPRAGWQESTDARRTKTWDAFGGLELREYVFRKAGLEGSTEIRVFNLFTIASQTTPHPDSPGELSELAQERRLRSLGAAQSQIIVRNLGPEPENYEEMLQTAWRLLEEPIETIKEDPVN